MINTSTAGQTLVILGDRIDAVVRTADAEAIHDMRTAIRRLGVELLARPDIPPDAAAKMRRTLKRLMRRAGRVRNCDVALQVLGHEKWDCPSRLIEGLQQRRNAAARKLGKRLQRWIEKGTAAEWRAILGAASGDAPKPPDEKHERRATVEMARMYFQTGRKTMKERISMAALHRLRVAAKKLRYAMERLERARVGIPPEHIDRTKAAQAELGAINDLRTTAELLADLGGHARIEAALYRRQIRKARDFRRSWKDFFSRREAQEWRKGLTAAR